MGTNRVRAVDKPVTKLGSAEVLVNGEARGVCVEQLQCSNLVRHSQLAPCCESIGVGQHTHAHALTHSRTHARTYNRTVEVKLVLGRALRRPVDNIRLGWWRNGESNTR